MLTPATGFGGYMTSRFTPGGAADLCRGVCFYLED